jgi:formylglycine-generating enzyme required for sulfatase activity/serine/threonine protein kinase
MGVTFLCEDAYEERRVVVKTLWRYATGSIKEMFSEAFTARKIDDPHIVKIYDIGRHRANRPFIVMEYCEGYDLEKYLREVRKGEPLSIEETLYIIAEVAKGLAAAHSQTPPIAHRDIKPTNILYNPQTGEVKIIDFGIACMLPEPEKISRTVSLSSASVITRNMAGTWGYMAPEQQRGETGIDPRIDTFSLGKTLMFLLTGKTPPPENIFALKAEIRDAVGELVGYCLMPHASERYNTTQMLEKIEEILSKKNRASSGSHHAPVTSAMYAATSPESAEEEMMATPVSDSEVAAELGDYEQEEAAPSPRPSASSQTDSAAIAKSEPTEETTPVYDSTAMEAADSVADPSQQPAAEAGFVVSSTEENVEEILELPPADGGQQITGEEISEEATQPPVQTVAENISPEPDIPVADDTKAGVMSYDIPADMQPLYDLETPTAGTADVNLQGEEPVVDSAKPDILVKEQEDGEICDIKPQRPLPKIDLPPGFHWSSAEEGDIAICDKDGATMIYIPAGVFIMGRQGDDSTSAETPEHEVTLEAYLIDQCPVTWYQYNLFCEESKRNPPATPGWEADPSQPVVNINWDDAAAYSKWAGKALPSEAQWEKAAKGGVYFDGDTMRMQKNKLPRRCYPWGDVKPNDGGDWRANCVQEPQYGERSCSPVGSYIQGASPYGCFDMAGNVWQWCEDWYNENYYANSIPNNPRGPRSGSGHALRGGAWNSEHRYITTTFRAWLEPDQWWNIVGFRTVLTLKGR